MSAVVARTTGRWRIDGHRGAGVAGRTNSSKLTMADTGLPGSPNTGVAESARTPKANGLAGLMATCIQRIVPALSFSRTTRTRSRSPTLTPPLVRMASHVVAAARQHFDQRGLVVADDPEVDARPNPPGGRVPAGSDGWRRGSCRGERAGSREELVARREHADPRTADDVRTRLAP